MLNMVHCINESWWRACIWSYWQAANSNSGGKVEGTTWRPAKVSETPWAVTAFKLRVLCMLANRSDGQLKHLLLCKSPTWRQASTLHWLVCPSDVKVSGFTYAYCTVQIWVALPTLSCLSDLQFSKISHLSQALTVLHIVHAGAQGRHTSQAGAALQVWHTEFWLKSLLALLKESKHKFAGCTCALPHLPAQTNWEPFIRTH